MTLLVINTSVYVSLSRTLYSPPPSPHGAAAQRGPWPPHS